MLFVYSVIFSNTKRKRVMIFHTHTHTQRERERERETETDTERQRDGDREGGRETDQPIKVDFCLFALSGLWDWEIEGRAGECTRQMLYH
jgi:hypothetical protein